jgi:predicted protein tyrosine phosphatase
MLPRYLPRILALDGYRPTHPAARGARSEDEYAGLKMRVLSAPKARAYTPRKHEVAISIRDAREAGVRLSPRFEAVLTLIFDDTSVLAVGVEGVRFVQTITAAQADSVVAFLREHDNATMLMIHCTAGVSRSRSLAAAICVSLGLPYEYTVINDYVYHAMTRAFGRAREGSPPATLPRDQR